MPKRTSKRLVKPIAPMKKMDWSKIKPIKKVVLRKRPDPLPKRGPKP
ncbi:MAG TPA: hypothetical protein VNA25_06820 [Phycisphaerae bacterium]|nr:hypothetical protein [Phycisphaerae bacterium]